MSMTDKLDERRATPVGMEPGSKVTHDGLHKAITEADRILRAALDKEGNDDE